jgi:hypothetical protein
MKNIIHFMLMLVTGVSLIAAPVFAHEGEHKTSKKIKHASHELKEAKEILGKLEADTEGHIAKASQSIDQAMQELSQVKAA